MKNKKEWLENFAKLNLKLDFDSFIKIMQSNNPNLTPDIYVDPCCPDFEDFDYDFLEFFGLDVDCCCPNIEDEDEILVPIREKREEAIKSHINTIEREMDEVGLSYSKYFTEK